MAEAETEPTGFVFLKQTLIYYSQIIPKIPKKEDCSVTGTQLQEKTKDKTGNRQVKYTQKLSGQ